MNERELIQHSLDGDQTAFGELIERHMRGLYLFAYQYVRNGADAEDVVQEAFFRAWKNLKSFDTGKNFKTWLFVIAKNISFDLLKKKKPVSFSQFTVDEEALDTYLASYLETPELPTDIFDRKLSASAVEAALAKLPQTYRTVLNMRYKNQLKFREIAEELGEPINTIKSKHYRGLALLRDLFVV